MTAMSNVKWRCAVVAVSVMALVAGCSSDDDPAASVVSDPEITTAESAPVSSEAEPADTGPTGTGSAVPDVDPAEALTAALDARAASGYHFVTMVSAGGGVAMQFEGDRVGDGMRFMVLRDEVQVDYVVTPDGVWAMPADGEWSAATAEPTVADPVPALSSATSVRLESSDGSTVTLVATVPRSALGYEGDDTADVTITIVDGVLDTVRYDSTMQGLAASILTTVGDVQDDTPIVAPI